MAVSSACHRDGRACAESPVLQTITTSTLVTRSAAPLHRWYPTAGSPGGAFAGRMEDVAEPRLLVMEESTSEFEVLEGNWLACTLCGATVWFSYMALHARWHHGPEVTLPEEIPENASRDH